MEGNREPIHLRTLAKTDLLKTGEVMQDCPNSCASVQSPKGGSTTIVPERHPVSCNK